MSEHVVWACTAIVIVAIIIGAPVSCVMNNTRTIERMVQQGADPIAVACAVALDKSGATCVASAVRAR